MSVYGLWEHLDRERHHNHGDDMPDPAIPRQNGDNTINPRYRDRTCMRGGEWKLTALANHLLFS